MACRGLGLPGLARSEPQQIALILGMLPCPGTRPRPGAHTPQAGRRAMFALADIFLAAAQPGRLPKP